ncbi:MAG: HAMP domain-containing histidine kinase [Gemmatimonadaceae bacterium]|nr:HAMP domain-containing histidine kinase [Gemmatimonadaceae bacterium]
MLSVGHHPLESAREAALRLLSRLVLWLWTPVFGAGLISRWNEPGTRPLILLVLGGLPFVGWLLQRPRWPAEQRARYAIAVIMLISIVPMIVNAPRALSTMAVVVVLTLSMLFYGMRASLGVLAAYVVAVVLNLVLSANNLVTPTAPEYLQPVTYRIVTILVMFTGLWFSARVLQQTIHIYRDAQAEAEARLQAMLEAQREVEVLQRRELVNVVTTGMTHDLANIVQVMTATAELLEEHPLPAEAQVAIRDLRRVGDEASTRLRTILTVGRETGADDTTAMPSELFARLDLILRPLMGQRVQVELKNEADAPLAIDRGRLEQVLINLALNARDAMPAGGTLRVHAYPQEDGVLFDVQDTGTGIATEVQRRMWEPFFTTKTCARGTGLGLAMVSRILEGARGRVRVSSAVGRGTTFSVWVPTAPV